MSNYPHLQKRDSKSHKQSWSLDNITSGFKYFFELHKRYPTSLEVESFDYLPNRKYIERNFGGMVSIRSKLGLEGQHDFTRGEVRSKMARERFIGAQDFEREFLSHLVSVIPEVRVHEHKIIRPGNTACDFFIYINDDSGVMVDIFYAKGLHSLGGQVRIKSLKCKEVACPIYYVLVGNNDIKQSDIDNLMKGRKFPLQSNISVVTESTFKNSILPTFKLEKLKN